MSEWDADAQNALNKLRRAYNRGTGARLTADEVQCLGLTHVGELWEDEDPREATHIAALSEKT